MFLSAESVQVGTESSVTCESRQLGEKAAVSHWELTGSEQEVTPSRPVTRLSVTCDELTLETAAAV